MSGGLAAVDVQGLAGDERRPFEVHDAVDDVADLAHPAQGVYGGQALYEAGSACICVLITPRETAFTLTPRAAYSMASERVTASSPPLVNDARAAGSALLAWATRLVVTLTMWPPPWSTICRMTRCVTWKNPVRFTATIAA